MSKATPVVPAFALVPRGDVSTQTVESLKEFFRNNPDDTLEVTVSISRSTLRDFVRHKRAGLGHYRGSPRVRRAA